DAVPPAPKQEAAVPSAPVASAPSPVTPPPAPAATPAAPPTTAPAAAPAASPAMTAADLNTALVAEYTRLGNKREPIDTAMRELGVQSVNDLAPEKYQELLDKVRAIPAPATA